MVELGQTFLVPFKQRFKGLLRKSRTREKSFVFSDTYELILHSDRYAIQGLAASLHCNHLQGRQIYVVTLPSGSARGLVLDEPRRVGIVGAYTGFRY